MKKLFSPLLIILTIQLNAQTTWSGDVAAILYKNCTNCHNPNGIGTHSFLDYNTASANANGIAYKVQSGEMPPWKADTSFKRFVHERILTNDEKTKILDWVLNGTPSGDLNQAPAPPVYPAGGILGPPDLNVKMPVYTSKATANSDDYICIAIPSGLTKTRKIKAVEVIPGNRKIVHHTLVFIDPTGQYQSDTIGGDCAAPSTGNMVTAYAPGGQPTLFPNGGNFKTGMTIPANSNIILAMHYPEGSAGQKDSTEVNFYFYDENETGVRELATSSLIENWLFCISPNTTQTVDAWYPDPTFGTSQDISLVSVFPHAHLLGKSLESYSINANNDTTPIIRIPHWDFEWQDFYFFKRIQKLETGSRLYGSGLYDNTVGNPHNPFNPPQLVCAGLNTNNEMFLFYFHYMPYQPGDELINIDSLMQTSTLSLVERTGPLDKAISVFPNPSGKNVHFEYELEDKAFVNLFIYDVQGKLVKRLVHQEQERGVKKLQWSGDDMEGRPAPQGVYFYSLKINAQTTTGKLILSGAP